MTPLGRLAVSLALAAGLALAPAARAEQESLRFYEATLTKFAQAVEPVPFEAAHAYSLKIFGFTICRSTPRGELSNLSFTMPGELRATGSLEVRWCGVTFPASIDARGDVRYDAATREIRTQMSAAAIRPVFFGLKMPFTIDVSDSISVPPIALIAAPFSFHSSRGLETVVLSPSRVQVEINDGYVEVKADVSVD